MTDAAALVASPAATLVLIRETDGRPPDLLMIERAAVMAFAGGATVFPGGRVDPGDRALAAGAPDPEDAAARIAAIRETIEETGVAVGLTPAPDRATTAAMRARLDRGEAFGAVVAIARLALDLDALVPFARWRPRSHERRIFDARFYLARAPAGAEPRHDGAETAAAFWMPAAAMLAAVERGERRIIFPTRRNLERLARFASFVEAAADAAYHPVTTITPWIETRGGEEWICIPEGLGYPVTAQRLAGMARG